MNGVMLTAEETTGMSSVIDAASDVIDLAFTIFERVLENPILLFFFAAAVIGLGVRTFKKLKSAAGAK